jgi:hypothetical protein
MMVHRIAFMASKAKAQEHTEFVRFYFEASIAYLIPRNPRRTAPSDRHLTGAEWEAERFEALRMDLAATLSKFGFDVAYVRRNIIDRKNRLFEAIFAVSSPCSIQVTKERLSARDRQVKHEKSLLQQKLVKVLGETWVIRSVKYEFVAAWAFEFEAYLGGTVQLRRVFSSDDLRDAGGVRDAIESFNNEVVDALSPSGFVAIPQNTMRRPKNDVYSYEVVRTTFCLLSDDDVTGNLSLMKKKMTPSNQPYLAWSQPELSISSYVEDVKLELEIHDFPPGADFVAASLELIDWNEDIEMFHDNLAP